MGPNCSEDFFFLIFGGPASTFVPPRKISLRGPAGMWHCQVSLVVSLVVYENQRGSHRGRILNSLALTSKVNSLALVSKPQVLENNARNLAEYLRRCFLFFEDLFFEIT